MTWSIKRRINRFFLQQTLGKSWILVQQTPKLQEQIHPTESSTKKTYTYIYLHLNYQNPPVNLAEKNMNFHFSWYIYIYKISSNMVDFPMIFIDFLCVI